MYRIYFSTKFKKDYKLSLKRGLKEPLIKEVITQLIETGSVPLKYKPHILKT